MEGPCKWLCFNRYNNNNITNKIDKTNIIQILHAQPDDNNDHAKHKVSPDNKVSNKIGLKLLRYLIAICILYHLYVLFRF